MPALKLTRIPASPPASGAAVSAVFPGVSPVNLFIRVRDARPTILLPTLFRSSGLTCLCLWLLTLGLAGAAEVMPPRPARYFNDYAGVVKPATAERLNRELEDFEKATSSQIVVAVFPKMQTDSAMEDFTVRIFNEWKPGQKGKDNGAVLFVFIQDRKMRIETGYGLEGALPDALGKQIIENEIKPRFKSGDFDGGLSAGVSAMLRATRGEYKGAGSTVGAAAKKRLGRFFNPFVLLLIFLLISILSSFRRRGTTYGRSGRSSWSGWSVGGGGGGWSSGGGGGGGFSGGGGSSGGGGASGSW